MADRPMTYKSKREVRWFIANKSPGPVRLMAKADGYAMVRRPGCMPFIMSEKEWNALPSLPEGVSANG